MFKRVSLLVFVFTLTSLTSWAQQSPLMGTWKMNPAKSSPPAPGANPNTSYVITREPFGKDGEKSTGDRVNTQGKAHLTFSAEYDGKDYAYTGDATRDTISIKRLTDSVTVQTFKKAGKVAGVNTRFVSKDGKNVYVVAKGTDAQGNETNTITVYDKQ
jgi:hypothetical protein